MTFTVLIYAIGGYAVVLLAAMLVLERVCEPVTQQAPARHRHRAPLRAWRRTGRSCDVTRERVLPLRSARRAAPARRQRPVPTSCRR